MNRILTLIASVLVSAVSMAQLPEAVFKQATAPIVIDGVIDAAWADANEYKIEKPFLSEVPTIGNSTFKAVWVDSGIFVLVVVEDDAFLPHYAADPVGNRWDYDNIELYFDVNFTLIDGLGSKDGQGHYQFAPQFEPDELNGFVRTDANNITYAFMVTAPTYLAEYFVPFSTLLDKDNVLMDRKAIFGFGITIIDRDPGDAARKRMVWSNDGTVNESYNNMDNIGRATLDGVPDLVYIESVTISGPSTITTNNGTVQLTKTIDPSDATIQKVNWTVSPSNAATISPTGLVKAIRNGEITITAAATDGSYEEATHVITVTNQILTLEEANLIKNGNFNTNTDGWGNYRQDGNGQPAVVEDGVVKLTTALTAEQWHYQFSQTNLGASKDSAYTLKFKAWSTATRPTVMDFEDSANGYYRYASTTSPFANASGQEGRSEWHFDVTTEPVWYSFDVVFDALLENTVEQFTVLGATSNDPLYLDSISLMLNSDLAILGVEDNTAIKHVEANKMDVYPNPLGKSNTLFVSLQRSNTNVAIYNLVGQKVMEKMAYSNVVSFDVSDLVKGIYIIQIDGGNAQKFIK